jgi:endonuclease/exonuclease/phosphatase family metal-dependent hydrolase
LQIIVYQNVARLGALTGWPLPLALAWALLGHGGGLLLVVGRLSARAAPPAAPRDPRAVARRLAPALLFVAANLVAWPQGVAAALLFWLGQVSGAALLATAVTTLAAPATAPGLRRTGALHGATALLLVLLTFLFYSGYDLALPFGVALLPPAAALLTAVALALGLAAPHSAAPAPQRAAPLGLAPAYPALLTALLMLIPAFKLLPAPPSAALPAAGPVRLLTYNLHNGFDPTGRLGMEALAQALEASGADVVALQEVSRGWAVNGALDMAAWLSQRLGMPYLFGPTADPLWGNALLSRYPIRAAGAQPLPPDDLLLRRGLLWAEIDVGTAEPLTVIVTHFHHPPDGGAVRARQAQALLDFWQGRPRTALLGDFNAHAGDAALALLRDAGLVDAWVAVHGAAPGYTFSATNPFERIDYVWLTPDLTPTAAAVLPHRASDHLPLVVEVGE